MENTLYQCFLATVLLTVISCSKSSNDNPDNNNNNSTGKYTNGFFVLHSYGDSTWKGIGFYSYDKDSLYPSVYKEENTGHIFGAASADLMYGTIYRNKLYLVASGKGHLVIVNPSTLKEIARIKNTAALDPHTFLGVSENEGLLSCGDGIYSVSLFKPALGDRINGINGFVGMMIKAGNYIFAYSNNEGVIILETKTYKVVKKIPAYSGFVISKDGNVWATGVVANPLHSCYLLRINPVTLKADTIPLPIDIRLRTGIAFSYRSIITASTKENVLYLVYAGKIVYRYVIGDPSSLNTPLLAVSYSEYLTGDMVEYDAQKDQLILLAHDDSYFPAWKDKIYFCDPTIGTILKTVADNGYYYTSMVVFH